MTITSLIAPSRERKYKQPQRATVRHRRSVQQIMRRVEAIVCRRLRDSVGIIDTYKSMDID